MAQAGDGATAPPPPLRKAQPDWRLGRPPAVTTTASSSRWGWRLGAAAAEAARQQRQPRRAEGLATAREASPQRRGGDPKKKRTTSGTPRQAEGDTRPHRGVAAPRGGAHLRPPPPSPPCLGLRARRQTKNSGRGGRCRPRRPAAVPAGRRPRSAALPPQPHRGWASGRRPPSRRRQPRQTPRVTTAEAVAAARHSGGGVHRDRASK